MPIDDLSPSLKAKLDGIICPVCREVKMGTLLQAIIDLIGQVTSTETEINKLHALARGSVIAGLSTGTGVLSAKGVGKILIGDGTDVRSLLMSGAGILDGDGVLTLTNPRLRVLTEALDVATFTDNLNTTGYVDLAGKLPAGAIVLGWKYRGVGAFDGDGSATMQVGIAGDLARFSAKTTGSCFTVLTIGSGVPQDKMCDGIEAETTVRVTVTTGADFTSCKTAAHGAGSLNIYYIDTADAPA